MSKYTYLFLGLLSGSKIILTLIILFYGNSYVKFFMSSYLIFSIYQTTKMLAEEHGGGKRGSR